MKTNFWAPAVLLFAAILPACGGEDDPSGEETTADASVVTGADIGVTPDIGVILPPDTDGGGVVECVDDAMEENDDLASAATLTAGSYDLSLCSEDGEEEDWFAIAASAGSPLAVALTFQRDVLDIDLALLDAEGNILASSQGVTGDETAVYTPEADMTLYARIFAYRAGGTTYNITIASDPTCASDEDCGEVGLICLGLECVSGCRSHDACGEDQVCVDYACAAGCRDDDACGEAQICLDYACSAGCRDDEACAEGERCIDNACGAGCRTSEHCQEGLVCIDNACQELSCEEDAYEPNSAPEQAASIALDFSEAGLSLCGDKDEDWFSVNLAADTIYQFEFAFTHEAGDIDTYLYASDDTETALARSATTSDDEAFSYRVPADAAGAHLVKVKLFSTGVYTQTYGASVATVGQAECAEHFDCPLGSICDEAYQCEAYLCSEEAPCPGGLTCNGASQCVECAAAADCPNAEQFVCEANRCILSCAEDAHEPNSERAAAAQLTLPIAEGSLSLCGQRDEDWFTLELQGNTLYAFDLTFLHAGGDIDARLYTSDGESAVISGASSSDDERFVYLVPEGQGGVYALEVRLYSGYGQSYSLAVVDQGVAECSEHADCVDGRLCQDYQCVDFVCSAESPCPGGLNCNDAGRCVTCVDDGDCEVGHTCAANECVFQGGAESEPNDSVEAANALGALPATLRGNLGGSADVDWYTFTLDAPQSIIIATGGFEGDSGDTELWLYSDAGVTEVANDDDGGSMSLSSLSYDAAPGQYWLKLACTDADPEEYCPEPFDYALSVRVNAQ